ncbi:MAG: NAD(P)-dependent oxidoreductase [Bacteroidota bacterium]|nr:NAD(P)-dependent oxidoreductase [Bacteroidota bacterium]
MKIGLLREEKVPVDKRVVLTPKQCKRFQETFSNVELVVQSSEIRCFSDQEYIDEGILVVENINDCDVLLGVKEVPKNFLISNKTYFYFSHTIKKQPYNRELLLKMIEMNITMVDYEVLKNQEGDRLLGFGRYAGIVGAYNSFLTYGLKSKKYNLKAAYQCRDRCEMEGELKNLVLIDEKIVVTGKGRVGNGIIEIMKKSGIKEVSIDEFLNQMFSEPVFVHLDTMHYNERIDGSESDKYDFYSHPELYKSSFLKFAKRADIFIAGHYYSAGSPYLFTRKDAKSVDFKLQVIADISCDIDGPVASTIRSSSIINPIYGYNPITEQEVPFEEDNAIAVMAVGNLPCELPKDASKHFGEEMLEKIFPALINKDEEQIIHNATICSSGNLNSNFEYLREYVNGY